jgi:DNA polymerase-2
MKAAKIAERHGFDILHGIVDSLWVKKKNNINSNNNNVNQSSSSYIDYCLKLKELIERQTGFAISFEGIYKWIVFVNSKVNAKLPVANRYFGVFENSNDVLKIRGIEARRHDTPPLLSKCQDEILQIIAKGNNIKEVKLLMPQAKSVYQKYVQLLKDRRVPIEDLVFTKQLSKNATDYTQNNRNTVEKDAIVQLCNEGKYLKAGQILRYVITDYYYHYNNNNIKKHSKKYRSIPFELVNDDENNGINNYDVRRYTELLSDVCNSVTEPFVGYGCFSSN